MFIKLQRNLDADLSECFPLLSFEGRSVGVLHDYRYVAAKLQRDHLLRKAGDLRDSEAAMRAIDKWRASNLKCKTAFRFDSHSCEVRSILLRARQLLQEWVDPTNCLDFQVRPEDGRFGPGATLECVDETFYAKSEESVHTYTDPRLVGFHWEATRHSPTFRAAERNRQQRFGHLRVQGSRLTTVPKDSTIDRVICIEPKLNMFFQQAARSKLERILRSKCSIDLKNQQTVQRELARRGSLDGSLATIDLSSASDTISMSFCEWLLPFELMDVLTLCRSPFVEIDGVWEECYMISSMGNATTFPLETLIFYSLAFSTVEFLGIKPRFFGRNRNIGVFGDDIIVPTQTFDLLVQVLSASGFTVNAQKSFAFGRFKESCGGDYFMGRLVTPVRLKTGLSDRTDLFSIVNRLVVWSATYGIPLTRTVSYLRSLIKVPLYSQTYDPVDSGIWTNLRGRYCCLVAVVSTRKASPSLHTILHGSASSDFEVTKRSRRVRYVKRWRNSVSVPSKTIDLGSLPGPVIDLLTVNRERWVNYLDLYDIPNQ